MNTRFVAFLCLALPTLFAQEADPRMSIREFQQNPAKVEALKRGVAAMKSRKPSDPTSWFFQAAIHGVSSEAIEKVKQEDPAVASVVQFWNKCPHNGESSADFLPWHRAYLFYFERILRKASGDPTLSLPYWDYTRDDRAFPEMFFQGGDDNALYDKNRELFFMFGLYVLSDEATDTAPLFAEKIFFGETESLGFAGGVHDSSGATKGMIEVRPHDWMHAAIGGSIGDTNGLMASVVTAAFDPVFWVHHANIDRIWDEWDAKPERQWGTVPPKSWFDLKWTFFDADGTAKSEPRSFWLQAKKVGVKYKGQDAAVSRLSDQLPVPSNEELLPFNTRAILATSFDVRKIQNNLEVSVALNALESMPKALDLQPMISDNKSKISRVFLSVEFSIPTNAPTVGYKLYLKRSDQAEEYIGPVTLFGFDHHAGHSHEGHHEDKATFKQEFDITRLAKAKSFTLNNAKISVRPVDLFDAAKGKSVPPFRRTGGLEIKKFQLLAQ